MNFGEDKCVAVIWLYLTLLLLLIMTVKQYYKNIIWYSSSITIVATIIFSIIVNRNYKSEWMTGDQVVIWSIIYSIVYLTITGCVASIMLLNKLDSIRHNSILSFITWFIGPCTFMFIVAKHEIDYNIKYESTLVTNEFVFLLILNLPYLVLLTLNYIKLIKENKGNH